MMDRLTRLFPLWIALGGVLAFVHPPAMTWVSGQLIEVLLALIMLGMGLSLTWQDLARVWLAPRGVLTGLVLQYTIMPLAGWCCAKIYGLPPAFAAGLILVACCPGGTASNLVTFLARGDVALSVSMTALSTWVGILLTPLLTTWLVGSRVEVDGWSLLLSTAKVVLLPVGLGLGLRKGLPRITSAILPFAPLSAVISIVLIVGSILGARRDLVLDKGLVLLPAIVSTHALGFGLGYLFGHVLSPMPKTIAARTISIEVGMQNSGLGVVLAQSSFADPLVAVPCAISSLVHCVLGCLCAAVWSRRTARPSITNMDV